jgi:protein MpaA
VETLLDAVDALGFDELGPIDEGRPIRGRRFGGAGPALLVFGGIHGDEPASVEALIELARAASPRARPPARRLAAARRQSRRRRARQQELGARRRPESQLPRALVLHRPRARLLSRPGAAVRTRDARHRRPVAREPIAAVVAVHAPFACVNYDGPAAAWAEAVAAACGWPARGDIGYPTPGRSGAGWDRSRPAGADPGASARAAGRFRGPRQPPGRIDPRRSRSSKLLDRRAWVAFLASFRSHLTRPDLNARPRLPLSQDMDKEIERAFLDTIAKALVSLPFDLKVLLEAVADSDLEREARSWPPRPSST